MAKIIQRLDLDLSSLPAAGETRVFQVTGDAGAIFSLDIKNEDDYWYDFKAGTFASGNIQSTSRVKNAKIPENGLYTGTIKFPSVGDNVLNVVSDKNCIAIILRSSGGTTFVVVFVNIDPFCPKS